MDGNLNHNRIFSIPCAFERLFGNAYAPEEKYFYVILRMVSDWRADKDGWFTCSDTLRKEKGITCGFDIYAFTTGLCKRARKKLIRDKLIECRYVHGIKGHRIGIAYRLNDEGLKDNARIAYDAILNRGWTDTRGLEHVHNSP